VSGLADAPVALGGDDSGGQAARLGLDDGDLLRFQGLIGGRWRDAHGGASIEVSDPATGCAIGTVPDMGDAETRAAIAAAGRAFRS